jgi:hypothetical protein
MAFSTGGEVGGHHSPGSVRDGAGERDLEGERERDRERGLEEADI